MTNQIIDDSKSMYSKQERADIYKYVAARFLVSKFAYNGVCECKRVSAYLYDHLAKNTIDPQVIGDIAEDFPEFEAQKPARMDKQGPYGTMTQWHDNLWHEDYIDNCIQWLEGALKLCNNG